MRADAALIWQLARLDVPDVSFANASVLIEIALMDRDYQPSDDLAVLALDAHRRAWVAYHVTLDWAELIEHAERVTGCTWDDLCADEEVPF